MHCTSWYHCLKDTSVFCWCGFTAESVNTRGTKSQTGSPCVYKTSYIFICLGGSRGSKWLSSVTSISSTGWNNMTDSTTEYQSTPLGFVQPNWIQISMMSSSYMEAASNGVPSPLVNTRMHIWLRRSTSSLGIQSWATKVVTVDVVGIVEGKGIFCKDVCTCDSENCTDYHNNNMIVKSLDP